MDLTRVIVGAVEVRGAGLDSQTRCEHYHSGVDIIAIRFPCCGVYYSCYRCHAELADHPAAVWPREQFHARAVLCGVCGDEMPISQYLECGSRCPECQAEFNKRCANHYALYFEVPNPNLLPGK